MWKADEGWRGVGVVGVAEAKGGLPAVDGWVGGRRSDAARRAIAQSHARALGQWVWDTVRKAKFGG